MASWSTERAFEEAIECALLEHGPDACAGDATLVREATFTYGEDVPGGYRRRSSRDYDAGLCLVPADVLNFILATQPKEWTKLEQHHEADLRDRFLKRLSREIGRRGALDVLRTGIKDSGCKFQLAYFRPPSGLNEELQRLHAANLFAVLRQLHYHPTSGDTENVNIDTFHQNGSMFWKTWNSGSIVRQSSTTRSIPTISFRETKARREASSEYVCERSLAFCALLSNQTII